jgi:hypothetical protein
LILNIEIVEAKDLEAKDANGKINFLFLNKSFLIK